MKRRGSVLSTGAHKAPRCWNPLGFALQSSGGGGGGMVVWYGIVEFNVPLDTV